MDCDEDYDKVSRGAKRSVDEEIEESPIYFEKKKKDNYSVLLQDLELKPMKPIVCENIVMGVGLSHLVTYDMDRGIFYLHPWDKDKIGAAKILKDWAPLGDGALPIIEVYDNYVFRADADAFVYVSDIETASLQFRVRCVREREDGNLDVFTIRAATITNSAIVMVSCPNPETSVIIVCPDWVYGNSRCVFVESRIPGVSSVIAESLTKFVFTSSVGLCWMSISHSQPDTWVLLPIAGINQALGGHEYSKEYKEREQFYVKQYNDAVTKNVPMDMDNVRALMLMEYPLLAEDEIPVHGHYKNGEYTLVSKKYFYHVNLKSAAIVSESKEVRLEDTDMLACANIGDYYMAITDEAEIIILRRSGRANLFILAYYSEHYQSEQELIAHSSCPPNSVFTFREPILAVNLYQRSLFLFEVQA